MRQITARLLFVLLAVAGGSAHAAPLLPTVPTGTLIEYPAPQSTGDLIVILSGDGGWADLDQQLGKTMAGQGAAVLGFDCYKYFNSTRSAERFSADLAAILSHYLAEWHKSRVVLVGFSFGAAVEPFALARFPESLRQKVALAVLLSSATYANWEIHWGDWLHDAPHASARPILPEFAAIHGIPLLCVYGTEEAKGSLCPTLPAGAATVVELPGGHHFDENYGKLADLILSHVP